MGYADARHRRRPTSTEHVTRRAQRSFLPEIQSLRMWAVGLVVVFHLWPSGLLRGGFVGVDAFFVISGYLITSHLLREVEATGRVRLAAFYARRARRLLPASLLVLLVCAVLTVTVLPQDVWRSTAAEILASTTYVQNLWLASQAVTYSASNQAASLVQHYWSLSAEEQFYLVWPALILLALAIARRRARPRPVRAIGVALVVVTLVSLAFSVGFTLVNAPAAYFVTPTRAWEFGAGGLVTLLLRRWAPPGALAVGLRYAGLLLIVSSSMVLSQHTAFPGIAAAWPVVGTALVIVAGDCEGRDRLGGVFTHRVTQWLGDISYSIYLWHWPLIVVLPYVTGGEVRTWHLLTVLAATLVLAQLSKTYVEDVTRLLPRVRRSARASLLAGAVGMLVVALAGGGVLGASAQAERQRAAAVEEALRRPCVGGRAGLDLAHCPDAFTRPPEVSAGPGDAPWAAVDGCSHDHEPYLECGWGDRSRTVALVGDSHAEHYRGALHDIARRRGWRLLVFVKPRCPMVDATVPSFAGAPRSEPGECQDYARTATEEMRRQGVDLVVTSAFATAAPVPGDSASAYRRVWDRWASFADVVVIRDVPRTGWRHMPTCVEQHAGNLAACSTPRRAAFPPDQLDAAARAQRNPKVHRLDLSDAYCDRTTCHAVGGGLPIYYDDNHITASFMQTLAPVIEDRLP